MAIEKIVVVDDEMMIRKSLETQLRNKRYSVASAEDLEGARKILSRDAFDLVFLDMRLPDGDGMELLEELSGKSDGPMVVMMTGYGSVESAVDCMRAGAFDYVLKPFSFDQVEVVVERAASFDKMKLVNRYYVEEEGPDASELVGQAASMQHLKEMVLKVAKTEATVLITGESGTGKELVAKELHKNSLLTDQPYIRVNCAAITETLMESEFFGHEKGSFTGATQRREGRFELADGGTILLDEISEIASPLQAKLLRVLQEKEFERVGGDKTIKVKVRVLATTNRNLLAEVENGNFREDLYYRLNVFPIEVPPLREHVGDIPLLAETFLALQARKHGLGKPKFSKEANKAMLEHHWRGNVRELENAVERAAILAEKGKAISPALLGLGPGSVSLAPKHRSVVTTANGATVKSGGEDSGNDILSMEEIERQHILLALETTAGNRTKTAELLGINVRTLRNKIRQYKLDGEEVP
ncbi:MAG: sigma-54 dependent transcriptional regulator [Opitutales bacterium]